jgi:hypothetical protein
MPSASETSTTDFPSEYILAACSGVIVVVDILFLSSLCLFVVIWAVLGLLKIYWVLAAFCREYHRGTFHPTGHEV